VTVRVAYTVPPAVPPQTIRLRTAKVSLERLSRLYGPYPWRTYTVVLPPDLGQIGIEYPTLAFVGYASPALVLRHETGHQWFYSLVGNDQYTDPWLDETGATWAERRLADSLETGVSPGGVKHVGESIAFWNSHAHRYYVEVYAGGVVALRSLGPAARIDCALRLYVARNAYRIAKPGDLLDALNTVFPGAEAKLRRFGIHR
jgi:aminopeptidase N